MSENRRKAERHPTSRLHVICPFCEVPADRLTYLKWCGNCYVQWEEDRHGNIWFDKRLKRPEFALAIALSKSGGTRIGPASSADEDEPTA